MTISSKVQVADFLLAFLILRPILAVIPGVIPAENGLEMMPMHDHSRVGEFAHQNRVRPRVHEGSWVEEGMGLNLIAMVVAVM